MILRRASAVVQRLALHQASLRRAEAQPRSNSRGIRPAMGRAGHDQAKCTGEQENPNRRSTRLRYQEMAIPLDLHLPEHTGNTLEKAISFGSICEALAKSDAVANLIK